MKTLSNFVATAVLLLALATLPGTLIAFRTMADELASQVPRFSSPVEEAAFWAHAFGP